MTDSINTLINTTQPMEREPIKMLINATQGEELRVALVYGQHLYNLDIEYPTKVQQKSNIYKAIVTRIERSLGAVFADFGGEKHGFLSGREIAKEYFKKNLPKSCIKEENNIESSSNDITDANADLVNIIQENTCNPQLPINDNNDNNNDKYDNKRTTSSSNERQNHFTLKTPKINYNLPLNELINEGQELIVQVEKEQRGNKGAALTTFISLAGCYLVLMPNNPKASGISKRIEGEDRDEIKTILNNLKMPEGMGVIVRTAGIGRSLEELQWDLDVLLTQWQAIRDAANSKPAPFLIYQESNLVIRCIRDHLRPDIEEILIDDPKVFDIVYEHMRLMRPDFLPKVKLYNDVVPLFSRFQIESQIESAYQREVKLKSGGSLVIDHTEALISIDINSAKSTKGADIEETALQTNLEAADEISRQLRLRDLGGLIVIDFIDMLVTRNQREVEQRLRHAMSVDRAKVQMGKISKFGLLEMSRQRLRPALSESIETTCQRCNGKGTVRNVSTMAINIIRFIEERAIEENIGVIIVELPIEIATFLMNEKRNNIISMEKKQNIKIILLPNKYINVPNYEIKIIKKEELPKFFKNEEHSYNLINKKELSEYDLTKIINITEQAKPAVIPYNTAPAPAPLSSIMTNHVNNIPVTCKQKEASLIKRIWQKLVGKEKSSSIEKQDVQYDKHHKSKKYPSTKNITKNHKFSNSKKKLRNHNRNNTTNYSKYHKSKKFNKTTNAKTNENIGGYNYNYDDHHYNNYQHNKNSNHINKDYLYDSSTNKAKNFKEFNNKPYNHVNENSTAIYIDNQD